MAVTFAAPAAHPTPAHQAERLVQLSRPPPTPGPAPRPAARLRLVGPAAPFRQVMDPSLISSQSSYFPSRFSGSRLRGFTLTELLVSLTVLLVLSTIAVATYAQFRDSGEATAAQNVLFELETTQRFWHRDHSTYLYDPLDLEEEVGTHLTFLGPDTSSAAPTEVSVSGPLDSGDTVAMAVLARSGECFVMVLSSVRDPRLVTDSYTTDVDACTGSAAATKVGTNPWGQP